VTSETGICMVLFCLFIYKSVVFVVCLNYMVVMCILRSFLLGKTLCTLSRHIRLALSK